MKTNGGRNAAPTAIRTLWSATAIRKRRRPPSRGTRRLTISAVLTGTVALVTSAHRPAVVDPTPRVANDDQRQGESDREEHYGHRRRVTHLEELEPVVVEEDRVEEGRATRVSQLEVARAAGL